MPRLLLAALLAAGAALHAPAQVPAATQIIGSNVGGLVGINGLYALGNGGVVTTLVFLTQTSPVNACEMAPGNRIALVYDATGVHEYELATGQRVYSTLSTGGGNLHFGAVDEDAGSIWVIGSGTSAGNVYRAARPNGTNSWLLTTLSGASFDAVARIGSSGHWAIADNTTASPSTVSSTTPTTPDCTPSWCRSQAAIWAGHTGIEYGSAAENTASAISAAARSSRIPWATAASTTLGSATGR